MTIHERGPCGGYVFPDGFQTVRQGSDLTIAVDLGTCHSWKGRIRDSQHKVLYEVKQEQSGKMKLRNILEEQHVTILFFE